MLKMELNEKQFVLKMAVKTTEFDLCHEILVERVFMKYPSETIANDWGYLRMVLLFNKMILDWISHGIPQRFFVEQQIFNKRLKIPIQYSRIVSNIIQIFFHLLSKPHSWWFLCKLDSFTWFTKKKIFYVYLKESKWKRKITVKF